MVTRLPLHLRIPENLFNSNGNRHRFTTTQASPFPRSVSATHRVRASNSPRCPFKISHLLQNRSGQLPISRIGSDQNRILIDGSARIDGSGANHRFSDDGSVQNRLLDDEQAIANGEREISEVESTIKKLRERAEKIRALEIEIFLKKTKGGVTEEERVLVEKMSREIVDRFLESAVGYLRFGGGGKCGDSGMKMGDLHSIERMFDLKSGFR